MTKQQRHMASMVRAILAGKWTTDPPDWAPLRAAQAADLLQQMSDTDVALVRAMQTAEAFIILIHAEDSAFDVTSFVRACGFIG